LLCCIFIFCQELQLGALSPLPKAIGSGLVAGLNAIGFGYQSRPKTLLKGANNVESCCTTGPNSVGSGSARPKTLQK